MPAILSKEIKNSIGFIFIDENFEKVPIGTGFWLEHNGFIYFVTAKHVIKDIKKFFIRLNTKDKSVYVKYNVKKDGRPMYHKNNAVDIAVLKTVPPKNTEVSVLNSGCIVDKNFIDSVGLFEGDDVFFVGLLPQIFGNIRNTPVVRTGRIALITDEPFIDDIGCAHYHFIEANCYPGNSGCPVFVRIATMDTSGAMTYSNSMVMLLGVMYGYLNQIKEVGGGLISKPVEFDENVNIAMVSQGAALLEILNS
ncbi:serine protease [Nanoarchaeota archaeon]